MKFPDASELTEEEKNLRVSFAEGDVYPYPGFMDHPLEVMIGIANACLLEKFSLQDALDEKKLMGMIYPSIFGIIVMTACCIGAYQSLHIETSSKT